MAAKAKKKKKPARDAEAEGCRTAMVGSPDLCEAVSLPEGKIWLWGMVWGDKRRRGCDF